MRGWLAALLVAAAFAASLATGSYPVNLLSPDRTGAVVLLEIRLPRSLMAVSAGVALGLSGLVLQSVFKNPLVDTYILGVNSGVALGAAVGFMFLPAVLAPLPAFLLGVAAATASYLLARVGGKLSPVALVLSGIIVSSMLSALLSIAELLLDARGLSALVVWLMGSLAGTTWRQVELSLPLVSLLAALVYLFGYRLDVVSLGEEARALGVDVAAARGAAIAVSALMASVVVSFTGVIGWVGLIVPHLARMSVGPRHRDSVPVAAAYGAALMLAADSAVRLAPVEVPVGVATTLVGVPFFAYLLRRTSGGWA